MVISTPDRLIKRGVGWRLGWDPTPKPFQALVGGEEWALELTAAEFADFCRLAMEIQTTMVHMAEVLMDEEKITCEAGSPLVWLEATGYPTAYTLHVILETGRRGEGFWPAAVVSELLGTLQVLKLY